MIDLKLIPFEIRYYLNHYLNNDLEVYKYEIEIIDNSYFGNYTADQIFSFVRYANCYFFYINFRLIKSIPSNSETKIAIAKNYNIVSFSLYVYSYDETYNTFGIRIEKDGSIIISNNKASVSNINIYYRGYRSFAYK